MSANHQLCGMDVDSQDSSIDGWRLERAAMTGGVGYFLRPKHSVNSLHTPVFLIEVQ